MNTHTEFSEDANKENVIQPKKKWKTPHTFVILVAIILIAAAATYFVPAGEFNRYEDKATGKTLVEAGSYHTIASKPINPLKIHVDNWWCIRDYHIDRSAHGSLQEAVENIFKEKIFRNSGFFNNIFNIRFYNGHVI